MVSQIPLRLKTGKKQDCIPSFEKEINHRFKIVDAGRASEERGAGLVPLLETSSIPDQESNHIQSLSPG